MACYITLTNEHPNITLILLGISIGATAVLDITGVFTNCWINYGKNCTGIVPFDSSEPAWLAATSWMMFISIGVVVVVMVTYIVVVMEILKRGYHHITLRKWFYSIRILSLIFSFLIVISIIVFLANVGAYKRGNSPYAGVNVAGWSCWLICITIFTMGMVEIYAHLLQRHSSIDIAK